MKERKRKSAPNRSGHEGKEILAHLVELLLPNLISRSVEQIDEKNHRRYEGAEERDPGRKGRERESKDQDAFIIDF